MASPLEPLTTVLVLTDDVEIEASFSDAVTDGRVEAVEAVATIEDALERLHAAATVGCVVIADDADEPTEALARLRERDESLPVLYYAGSGGEDEARRATVAGADAYLPADTPAGELRAAIADCFDRYERQRWRATRSDALDGLLDVVPGSLYVKDREGRHLVKSSVQGDVSPEEALGKTDAELYDDQESYREDRDVIETGEPVVERESSFEAPDGTRWLRTTKRPWRPEDGTIEGLVGWTVDATDDVERDQRLESQERRLAAVADTFAHDLRAPLQLAGGYLERARETGDPSDFDDVRSALDRIDEMLGDLRSLVDDEAREIPDSGELLPETSLAAVTRDVWTVVASPEASLAVDAPDATTVHAPPQVLRPVLENLLKNAITHAGEDVHVRVGLLDDGGFYVADDGSGIPPEEREAVRRRGYSTAGEGSGIGLSLVDDVADHRGWDLAIGESDEGGARIELSNCPVVRRPSRSPASTTDRPIETFTDVGTVEATSEASYDEESDRWAVAGGGRAIVNDINEFHYAAATVEPPVRVEGRLAAPDGPTEWSTAALVLREDCTEDAAYGGIGRAQGHGVCTLWRPRRGHPGSWNDAEDPDGTYDRFRLQLDDGLLTASVADDSGEWVPYDQRRLDVSSEVYAGMAVCSTLRQEAARAVFEAVRVEELSFDAD